MSSLKSRLGQLLRLEPLLFFSILIGHLLVLYRFDWYPTLDGPAHLYNAHLIKQMLLGDRFLHSFYEFSTFPEPNWSGHAIMALLSVLLPANLVEKGLVLLIFAGTAISFRLFVRGINSAPGFGSLLIFPFLCTHTFRMGFFNFSLSIAFVLLLFAYWNKIRNSLSPGKVLMLSILIGSTYFSNALTALIGMGSLGLWIIAEAWLDPSTRMGSKKRALAVSLASLPWIILILVFVIRGSGEGTTVYLPAEKLWSMVRDGIPFTLQNGPSMILSAQVISISLVLLTALMLFFRWRDVPRKFRMHDAWLLFAVFSLIAYMLLPDKAASGWIISVRYLLFLFLFLAIWIAAQPRWPIIATLVLIPYFIADSWLVRMDHYLTWELNKEVAEMRSALPHVRDRAIILPLSYSDNWLVSNFSNYLGTERGILVIDNYEAMSPHFPLRWRPQHRAPNMERSFFNSNRPCINIEALGDSINLRFDHVIRWEFREELQDSCTLDLSEQLEREYRFNHRSPEGKVELHQR